MSWSEISPGWHQRPLGENEQFIKLIGDRAHPAGREQWSVTATGKFKACDNRTGGEWSDILREAWKLLRFEHPSIASTVTGDVLEYVTPTESSLAEWLKETFFVVEGPSISADDLISSLKPSPFVTVHFLPHRWEIVVHTAHWRTDGYGAFQLLNAFFTAVASVVDSVPTQLSWGEESTRLVPSVETALDLPVASTAQIETVARQYLATGAYLPGTVGIAYRGDLTTRPGGTRSVRLQVPKTTTAAIAAACQTHGVDLFSAVHAALAAVNFAKAPANTRDKHYTSTIRLSLRQHLPEPYNSPALASGLYTGGYLFKVAPTNSWTENAKQYQAEYERGVTKEFLESRRQYAILGLEALRRGMPPPPVSNVDISIVEAADKLVNPILETKSGPIEILELSLGVETLNRQTYLFSWMFRGHLEFNLWYNEAYYDVAMAAEVLETLRDILVKELQVEL